MNTVRTHHRAILQRIARRVMLERGLRPDFSQAALDELSQAQAAATQAPALSGKRHGIRDLRDLPWSSIDNDDSRDLDQLTVAESGPDQGLKIRVAIADVAATVQQNTALDEHAQHNTTSVYTAAMIFPMLPEGLSTDLTSLNPGSDRQALIVEMSLAADGTLLESDIYPALVRNHAQLAYNSLGAWLEARGPLPPEAASVDGLAANLQLQDRAAQALKALRHGHGALNLETIEPRPIFDGDDLQDLQDEARNRAKDLIEDFMIAANGVTARYLSAKWMPSLRRVVKTPKRWERIVALAATRGATLPAAPDSLALERFLIAARADDPAHFPDLSLSIIKLLGAGEYVVEHPGETAVGHFGLAVKDYTHATAPNRRFPDLVTQRMLKAALGGHTSPYEKVALEALAKHCTEAEDAAKKVERQLEKSAAALLLEKRIGERFDAIVTGASDKGTWVRLLHPPVEGRLVAGHADLDVGDDLRVKLVRTDVERGYIDFEGSGQ
ncbi:MAG: RNB domain-containing ribonuclease [Anaerolineales bacterium]|nr:RNB domain-containing ribonuclease [Anaerolineales bacterium]